MIKYKQKNIHHTDNPQFLNLKVKLFIFNYESKISNFQKI